MNEAANTGDWSGELAITGIGLVTPVGLKAESSIAALRAGVSRLSQLPGTQIRVDKEESGPIIGAEVPHLPDGRQGIERISALLKPAFEEVVEDAGLDQEQRIGVFMGTAGPNAGGRTLDQTRVMQHALLNAVPDGISVNMAKLVPAGRASVLQAIRQAAEALETGQVDVAIIGAADSLVSPRALMWLRENRKLIEYPRKTGAIPGEAAGFLALEKPDRAHGRKARSYALISASAGRHEPAPYGEPSHALALAQSIQSVFSDVSDMHILMITDQDGERYRALEWVLANPKALNYYDTLDWRTPADCIGDTGAASGSVMLGWAATALARGYAGAQNVLVWGTSDEGAREAVRLQPAGGQA